MHMLPLVAVNGSYSLAAVSGLLLALASLGEHGLQGMQASVAATRELRSCGSRTLEHRLNSCGTGAQLLLGMWDLP